MKKENNRVKKDKKNYKLIKVKDDIDNILVDYDVSIGVDLSNRKIFLIDNKNNDRKYLL